MRPRSNRQNEFSQFVEQSTLDAEVRHQLHFVNRWKVWFGREPLIMKDGTEIPQSTRRLARQIMRRVLSRHRKPDFSRIGMVLDQRAARLREAERSTEFNLWIRLSTLDRGRPIEIPLKAHDYFRERRGTRKKSIQVNERDGRLYFGVVTDISAVCEAQKQAYRPRTEEIRSIMGSAPSLPPTGATCRGRGFLQQLRYYDWRISSLAAYRQKHGLRIRSPRYDRYVRQRRGFLETEIHRVLNRLVEVQRPARIVVEKLRFRSPNLSKRMNRLVTNAAGGSSRRSSAISTSASGSRSNA